MPEFVMELNKDYTADLCSTLNDINQNIKKNICDDENSSYSLVITDNQMLCTAFHKGKPWIYIQVQERLVSETTTARKSSKKKPEYNSNEYITDICQFYTSQEEPESFIYNEFNLDADAYFRFYRDYKKDITTMLFMPEYIMINTSIRNVSFKIPHKVLDNEAISNITKFCSILENEQYTGYELDTDELEQFASQIQNMNQLKVYLGSGYTLNTIEEYNDEFRELIFSSNSMVKIFTKKPKKGDTGMIAVYHSENPELFFIMFTQSTKKFEVFQLFKARII